MKASYYNWGVQFITTPAAVAGFTSYDLNTRAISMSPPTKTEEESEVNIRGNKDYQHAIITYNPLEITLQETVDSKVGSFLEAWTAAQWDPTTGQQRPKNQIEATILLTLLDSMDVPRAQYTLVGAWVTSFDHGGSYDGSNSDTVKFNVNLRYTYYKYQRL
jgi:hypothetical protein